MDTFKGAFLGTMCQFWQSLKILENQIQRRRATDCESHETGRENSSIRYPKPREFGPGTGRPIAQVPERLRLFIEGLFGERADSHNVVAEQPVGEPKEKTADDMR